MGIRANKQVILDGDPMNSWEQVKTAYRQRMENFGPGHKALHYSSEAVHQATLAYASKLLHAVIQNHDRVLDVGCGVGALVPFMPPCIYTGIDIVPESVELAGDLYPNLQFDCANLSDISATYDWVVMIGFTGATLNPEKLIHKAWRIADKGVIIDFNDSRKCARDEFNTYKMGACTEFFLDMGATRIDLYPTPNVWNIFVVHKQAVWL